MKKLFVFAFACVMLAGCKGGDEEKVLGHDELIDSIATMDSLYAFEMVANPEKANAIIDLYTQFVKGYPEDSLAPVYLTFGGR